MATFAAAQDSEPKKTDANQTLQQPSPDATTAATKNEADWKSLITDRDLSIWKKTNFGGEGDISVDEDNVITLAMGDPQTGINVDEAAFEKQFQRKLPRDNYELKWSANRVQGSDFFVGLTFPVGEDYVSFISGGWGGGISGLSSLNGNDASENKTTQYDAFDNDTWYEFKLRVDPESITVWRNGESLFSIKRAQHTLSIRNEVRVSRPLGYSVFQSDVLLKDFSFRIIQ
jgi:hypothetical protein